jgi:hypothetical protein
MPAGRANLIVSTSPAASETAALQWSTYREVIETPHRVEPVVRRLRATAFCLLAANQTRTIASFDWLG